MYRIVLHRRAARYLKRLPVSQKNRIKSALIALQNHPSETQGVKGMAGDWSGYFRMRVGDTRIIFWIDEEKGIVYVDHIGPRGDIYK